MIYRSSSKIETKTEDEKSIWYRTVLYPKLMAELAANNQKIAEYRALKSAIINLINDLHGAQGYIIRTREAVTEAMSFSGFEVATNRIGDYANSINTAILKLETSISEIDTQVMELEDANRAIRAQLGS